MWFLSLRESLCSVLLALEHHLDEIATTGEKLITLNELIVKIDKQMDIFKDAISTPDHPLISMQGKWVSGIYTGGGVGGGVIDERISACTVSILQRITLR